MAYPDRETALQLLTWAYAQNPGPWLQHSKNVARAAEAIANACGLNADKAYVLGLLHDIGRYEGVRGLHHVCAGHELMLEKGYPDAARICLSHSFPIKDIASFNGKPDCSQDELQKLQTNLNAMNYDAYDRLIQLCDALATADGIVTIQQRLIDVAIRNGVGERYRQKWEAFLDIKQEFDRLCGCNIYTLFRQEIENSIFE